jgi:hypothetical protein
VGALFLEFLGEGLVVEPSGTLTFGRAADLVVDESNPYLHRVLGCFAARDSVWFLQNMGRHIPLRILDVAGTSRIELGPGDQVPIGFEEFLVRFEAGRHRYEISGALAEPTPLELGEQVASDTVEFGVVRLNDEQRLLVLALAEPLLRGDHNWSARLPSNKEVAGRLGWKLSKYNRKLDYLCRRLAEMGVDGLQGEAGRLASARRVHLVEHLVKIGAVTVDELDLLPPGSA